MRRRSLRKLIAMHRAPASWDREYYSSAPPPFEVEPTPEGWELRALQKIVDEGQRSMTKFRRHCAQMNAPIAVVTHR